MNPKYFFYLFEFNIFNNFFFILIKDCGGLLEYESGDLASPNWPRNYGHNLNCSWTITVPKFKVQVLL